ncbi:alpha/beta hydrolase family protein [Aquimarina muelleri]|uniref:alpha/beta hydrolase family protein n=1 Tax=Aquimarina muelleri TaxID=279356 RepID=UPI0004157875|nr:prolyl oligopeptidase family serine peptidase [Aquimarina muelleri]MCX2764981.1 prolyl oligopeptidase family serine peptidase [Aquimarina muelleri]
MILINKKYNETSKVTQYLYDSLFYETAHSQKKVGFFEFDYKSDEFLVKGFITKPLRLSKKKYPVIIYNRGGTGNYGKISAEDFPFFYKWYQEGFIVVASNYRFVNERGPFDQFGGSDINDVISLFKYLKVFDFIDLENVFMIGVSRGGMMTYKLTKYLSVNAAAVIGGVTNLKTLIQNRPVFLNGWNDAEKEEDNYKGLRNILKDFDIHKEQYIEDRSAVRWANKINTPIYILHSRQDGFVSVNHAIEMAGELEKANKEYQLKVYNEKSHSLPFQYFDSHEEISDWFKKHMK